MADLQHSSLAHAQVHEPKHITINGTAASGKVITNSGSTPSVSEYRFLRQDDIDELQDVIYHKEHDSSVQQTHYIYMPFAGTIVHWGAVIDAALVTSSNTYELQIDGVTVTGSPITFPSGGAAGDQQTANPSAANTFSAGDNLMVVCTTNGNTDATVDTMFTIVVERS